MDIDAVDKLLRGHTDSAAAVQVLEDSSLALLREEALVIARYGFVEDKITGIRGVKFVGITRSSVLCASFAIVGKDPKPVHATLRRWRHAREWGFVNSVGYNTSGLANGDGHPMATTLLVRFDGDPDQLKLRTGTPYGTLRFTWAELGSVVEFVQSEAE